MASQIDRTEFQLIPCERWWTEKEADALFEWAKGLPRIREDNEYMGRIQGKKRIIGLGSFSVSAMKRGVRDGVVNPKSKDINEAPQIVRDLAERLTKVNGGKEINYLSFIAYENERDHIEWHQHNEDRCRDATVYIASLGETRTFGIRRVCEDHRRGGKGCKNNCGQSCFPSGKKLCIVCKRRWKAREKCKVCEVTPRQWHAYQPEHGSLIVLPHDYNRTHEHAVLGSQDRGGDKRPKQLRISINTKTIRPEDMAYLERENRSAMNHGDGEPMFTEGIRAVAPGIIPPSSPVFTKYSGAGMRVVSPESLPWEHVLHFIEKEEADALYKRMVDLPHWNNEDKHDPDSFAIAYGKSYLRLPEGYSGPGGRPGEIPEIPDFLKELAAKVSARIKCPVNYVQCHKYGPNQPVSPHEDPAGMTVPMLTIGQERTFRVGGHRTAGGPQITRPLDSHKFKDEYLMHHGDLLIFNGGKTTHSMVPAADDPQFNANGYQWRISILFRWTTDIMREYGPGGQGKTAEQKKQYEKEIDTWRKMQSIEPRVWSAKKGQPEYPPDAVYVGCRCRQFAASPYANDWEPHKGHHNWIANTEAEFRTYAEKKMLDPSFRAQAIADLKGKHLLCWCIQDGTKRSPWCHARVWLDIIKETERM